ncbi:hypothetical protein [Kordia sp.]|uniref:hypothetical protein n=1 Tax=Kordia sp. TaxID=1965332 RepID=UPI003D2D9365
MKRKILKVQGAIELTKKEQTHINGAGPIALCDMYGNCPPGSTCIGDVCYTNDDGGGNPGGGCNEPKRVCQPWETGCGCVYF